jgi:ribosomal protein S18 acetylase RimI-like enzyme
MGDPDECILQSPRNPRLNMNANVVVIDEHTVELHDAFIRFVPQVFSSIGFRRWYELGGWRPGYRSFAILDGENIVANTSVQRMEVIVEGDVRTGWQLGAVGVLPQFRGRGLQRTLMQSVLSRIEASDFLFLFANEDALEFYPLFGFRPVTEWLFGSDYSIRPTPGGLRRLSIDSSEDRKLLARIAANAQPVTQRCGARNYGGILLWYWSNFHQQDFYYDDRDDAIVVAEQDMEALRILDVLASHPIDLRSYLPQLVSEPIDHIEFAFTPERYWPAAESLHEYMESQLFVRGDVQLPAGRFKFPVLAQT